MMESQPGQNRAIGMFYIGKLCLELPRHTIGYIFKIAIQACLVRVGQCDRFNRIQENDILGFKITAISEPDQEIDFISIFQYLLIIAGPFPNRLHIQQLNASIDDIGFIHEFVIHIQNLAVLNQIQKTGHAAF